MNDQLILGLLLLSVIATEVAVALQCLNTRAQVRRAARDASDATLLSAELASLLAQLTARAEHASSELEQQHEDLVRLGSAPPATRQPARPSSAQYRKAGVISDEEVRLREALHKRASA